MINLRPYQKLCVDSLMQDLKEGFKKLCVVLSTGSGKSIIFIELIVRYLNEHPSCSALILSRSSLLTQQTFNRFHEFYPSINIGILQKKRIPNVGDKVVIATIQSATEEKKTLKWLKSTGSNVKLIIVDEMHTAEDTKTFESSIIHHDAQIVGFTATPFRDSQLITNMFDKVSFSLSMQELIDQKYLVPLELVQIPVNRDVEIDDRIATVISIYKEKEFGKKAVMYWRTVEEANLARNVFDMEGIKCSVVTGDVNGKTRDGIMESFNKGDTLVLSTCDVLTAGIDMPKLEVIFMPYGTYSPTVFLQRCGRGSRPEDADSVKPQHQKQNCRIYLAGDVPTIKSGFYKKLLNYVLNEGNLNYEKDIYDDLEFMEIMKNNKEEIDSQKYEWTKEACKIAKLLESKGLSKLSALLKKKEFPKKYLRNLNLIADAMCELNLDSVAALDIAIRKTTDKWVIPSGKFMGKKVSELPIFYTRWVLKHAPSSYIAAIIKEWRAQNAKKIVRRYTFDRSNY